MDTEFLRSFHAVATSGSFTAAAQQLNKSQSTVSGHVANLEELLATRLFNRTTRSCNLTPEGQQLLSHAANVLTSTDHLLDAFRPTLLGGRIRLGVPDDTYLFPLVTEGVKLFLQKRPNVTIEITAGLADHLRSDVQHYVLDLAIVRTVVAPIAETALCRSRLRWIARRDFKISSDNALPLAHVNKPCRYFNEVSSTLTDNGIKWKSAVSCTSLNGVLAMVRSGLAIAAILEHEDVEPDLFRLDLPLPELPTFALDFVYAGMQATVLAQSLADAIRQAMT